MYFAVEDYAAKLIFFILLICKKLSVPLLGKGDDDI